MRIIFEEHQYEATPEVMDTLKDISALQDVEKKIAVNYVGYFYNSTVRDCVFILPKVLLKDHVIYDEEGKKQKIEIIADIKSKDESREYITPEDIITRKGQEKYLDDAYRKFIYEFSVWIYRALYVYLRGNADSKAIYYKQIPQSGRGKRHKANTFLDIILSLIEFNRKNQDFFMFTIKNIHSGVNKINWQKTISKSECFIQEGTPMYLNPVNKKRKINFDEELFIIFFSILNHLNAKYGFRTPISFQYELLSEKRFEQYLKGYGKTRLRQIKYKYFSDKALMLWDLCYAFFDSAYQLAVNTDQKEYLLAKNFNIVFEAMIDELIGTPHDEIPKGLADQKDGKRVDHMYMYDSLVHTENKPENEIYYIGDSKYYKADNSLGSESIYKQYTYARNVIQWNVNLFLNEDLSVNEEERKARIADRGKFQNVMVRKDSGDNVAEGYNVIPNFFISAFVYPNRQYVAQENIKGHEYKENGQVVVDESGKPRPQTYISYQFPNRLFDRDTLILSHYDVNFLYVLYLYARDKASEKTAWRAKVRLRFKDEIRKVLEEKFDFYAMMPHEGEDVAQDFMREHFSNILGKIYTPYVDNNLYALALSKDEKYKDSNKELKDEAGKFFYITEKTIRLGEDPAEELNEIRERHPVNHIKHKKGILVGLVRSKEQFDWIKEECKYNIRKKNSWFKKDRHGSMVLNRDLYLVHDIVLYRLDNEQIDLIGMFPMVSEDSIPSVYNYEDMKKLTDYPYGEGVTEDKKKEREYIMYEIDPLSMRELTDADKEYYKSLIDKNGVDESGEIGKPFVI